MLSVQGNIGPNIWLHCEQQSQTSRLPSRYFEFGMLTEKSGVFAFGIMKMEVLSLDWTKLSLTKVKVPGTD